MSQSTDTTVDRDPAIDNPTDTEPTPPPDPADSSSDSSNAQPSNVKMRRHVPKRVFFFGTCAVIAIVIYAIVNIGNLSRVFSQLGAILAPITIGGVIAYLCNPIMRFYEYVVFGKMKKSGLHSGLSLLLTVVTFFGLIAGVIALIVPELINSIQHLVSNLGSYADSLESMIDGFINRLNNRLPEGTDIPSAKELLAYLNLDDIESVLNTAKNFLSKFNAADGIWKFVVSVFNAVTNLFLGMFIAFYILGSKEKRSAQIRKARAALLNEKQDKKLTEIVTLVDKTFGGYMKGLLLDALAVGVITFLLLTIFRVSEYNLLIAAICAVTNVIPVFGPFIGAIPSGLIVLISNPSKLILFLILILVIQQIEGNIIMPRIQGNSTGISSLAVLIAITVMGSLFGVVGMIIGVPIFAVIIELVKRWLEEKLKKRGLATDTVAYYPSDSVGNAEEEVYYEHSHLRYKYEHSKLKKYVDRFRARMDRRKQKRQAKKNPNAGGNGQAKPTAQKKSGNQKNKRKKK